jgi:hypothetical protein
VRLFLGVCCGLCNQCAVFGDLPEALLLRRYTFWLMLQLCISPKTACAHHDSCMSSPLAIYQWEAAQEHLLVCCRYRHTSYHKQTKNQWARDDPAYVIICCLLVAAAASAYCVAYAGPAMLPAPCMPSLHSHLFMLSLHPHPCMRSGMQAISATQPVHAL